jgi:uncharacterized protein with HEPN domain
MKHDDRVLVKHILDSANKLIFFTDGKSRKDLDNDEKLSLAIIRLFEIMGEAANSISEEFQEAHQNIPWEKLISMRNRLIHGYFDINYDIVWNTVKQDIPPIVSILEKI